MSSLPTVAQTRPTSIIGTRKAASMSSRSLNEYTCRLCAENFEHKARKQSRATCTVCGENQGWTSSAPEPDWWPRWIHTVDNQGGRGAGGRRWTNWVMFAISVGFLVLLIAAGFVADALVPDTITADSRKYGRDIPDVVGMNLQSAQDCLQEWGFYSLDDQPVDPSQGRFQIFDRNWVVQRQSRVGPTKSSSERIVLYVLRATTGNSGTTFCPWVNK